MALPTNVSQLALPAALLGFGLHLGYFIRGEHHTSNARIFLSGLLGPPAVCLYFYLVKELPPFESIKAASLLIGSFLGSLTTSILIYRHFFHKLRHFPGPVGAGLTKWWQVKKTLWEYNTFELLHECHIKYGDFVRTGPNELSIVHPDIVDAVYGPDSKCTKGVWYDMSLPITSLQQLRDRGLHDKRKRQGWDKAFSQKSLRSYDSRVTEFADLLVGKLDAFAGKPANVTNWFNFYSYDVMGSLGFGRSFDTLKSGGSHRFVEILKEGTKILQSAGCIVYVCNLATKVPGSANPITQLNLYSEKRVEERKQNKNAEPDIIGHLIESEKFFGDPKLDHDLLLGDSRLVIVAGSDTTAAALTYTFYYIAKDPSIAQKIRDELKEHGIENDDSFSVQALQNLPYLNGVMNEGLRLHPPVPGGVFRISPPEGFQVGDWYIPGNVALLVPPYTVQRSPKNFVKPESFVPERWTTKTEMVINKNALMPFTHGPFGCIGKQLAMGELRTVISKIVLEFDVRLAPDETGADLFAKQVDSFTLNAGKLDLCFVRRGQIN